MVFVRRQIVSEISSIRWYLNFLKSFLSHGSQCNGEQCLYGANHIKEAIEIPKKE